MTAKLPPNISLTIRHREEKKAIYDTLHAWVGNAHVGEAKFLIRKNSTTMKIIQMDVFPPWQRRGIGTLLSDKLKAIACERGCKRITLLAIWETRSQEFWKKQGFKYYKPPNFMEFVPQSLNSGLKLKSSE